MFVGNVASYPGWQATVVSLIHVQNVEVIHKCQALDKCITEDVRKKLGFHLLGANDYEYYLRIVRLEDYYGGKDRQLEALIDNLRCLGKVGKERGAEAEAHFALDHFLMSCLVTLLTNR